jgi:hypothetical protein
MSNWVLKHGEAARDYGVGLTGARWLRRRHPMATRPVTLYVRTWFGTYEIIPR